MPKRFPLLLTAVIIVLPAGVAAHGPVSDQVLKGIKVPVTPGLLDGKKPIVVDQTAAIQLGKALFWDVNVGSDGVACASCHFHAGADRRTRNQLGPGLAHANDPASASAFSINANESGGPNYELKAGDFPFFRFADTDNKNSPLLFSTDDVTASAGVFLRQYQNIDTAGGGADHCASQVDAIFHADGMNTRQTTKRNAPTVINAAFNFRNFWDGRANNIFNGVSPFGSRDPNAKVWIAGKGKKAKQKAVALKNASLASQAVGPVLDMMEMSCAGRNFAELGRKLLPRRPLETQQVHAQDSVLAVVRDASGYGLGVRYEDLIKKAFAGSYWSGAGDFGAAPDGVPYTQAEANFAFFFGLAIQLYENTLVSDQAPFDEEINDEDGFPPSFSPAQKRGFIVFQDAHCSNCHSGPIFSSALNPELKAGLGKNPAYIPLVERLALGAEAEWTLFDIGFANTSVVPDAYDAGVGGTDPFGNPLSFSEQYRMRLADPKYKMADSVDVSACELSDSFVEDFQAHELVNDKRGRSRCKGYKSLAKVPAPTVVKAELGKTDQGRISTGVVGAFKIPTLRNVELTGPYMHNGSMKSLEEVIEFYNRAGNLTNRRHFSSLMFQQGFNEQDKQDLIAFLKTLTDERVRWEKAPFDHPEILIPHGHEAGANPLGPEMAKDAYLHLPAVGKDGRTAEQGPLLPFEDYLQP